MQRALVHYFRARKSATTEGVLHVHRRRTVVEMQRAQQRQDQQRESTHF